MNWSLGSWVVGSILVVACSPALDWREIRPDDTGLTALFPCKPGNHLRQVDLGGTRAAMAMLACSAAGETFVLSHADVADPRVVGHALSAMRAASIANVGGQPQPEVRLIIPGMTPNERAARFRIDGHLPDNSATHVETVLFVRGTRVFQASVVGSSLDDSAIDAFFSSLRFGG